MRIGCADLVSNTFFPVIAAEELDFYRAEGLEASVELVRSFIAFPALRDGSLDFVAGPAHGVLRSFPQWKDAKLVVAIAQGVPWLLVVRAALPVKHGDMKALKGLRLTSAPGPRLALRQLLIASGLDPEKDVQITALPDGEAPNINGGVFAAEALEADQIDGFWANAMGAEISLRRGVGKIHLDVRRGDGPPEARHYTFAVLATTEKLIARDPECVAAAVRAIVRTQQALRADPTRAAEVGKRRFPPDAAELIATIIERDLPFYDAAISEEAVNGLNSFAQSVGLLAEPVSYEQVVAARFRGLWRS